MSHSARTAATFATMTTLTKHFLLYSIFLALIAGALFYWNYSQPIENVLSASWGVFAFFAVSFLLNHLSLLNAENKKPGVFIRRFMGTSTLRLFVFVIIIVLYAMTHKTQAHLFILHFLIFYFLFATFEIATLYNHFRPKE